MILNFGAALSIIAFSLFYHYGTASSPREPQPQHLTLPHLSLLHGKAQWIRLIISVIAIKKQKGLMSSIRDEVQRKH